MPKFSPASLAKLETCHRDLQMLFNTVILHRDCTIICGRRGELAQNQAFADGKSKLQYPHSKHNKTPSRAVDVKPYPMDKDDISRLNYFSGYVMGVAELLHYEGLMMHRLRWGGDWDGDTELSDNRFNDLYHYELIGV